MEETVHMDELKKLLEYVRELLEYVQHDSWRCTYYDECHCGLDALTDKMGFQRIPRPDKTG